MQKTAIVLVPEISLTPQMLDRFISRFGKEKIAVLHSKLSIGEKYDIDIFYVCSRADLS